MKNPVGIISMQYIRPFNNGALHYLKKTRELGFDFIELLVPEPEDDLDPAEVRRICEGEGLEIVLAARVNLQRSIASEDAANRQGGIDYLKYCIEAADRVGAKITGGPLYGEPLVFAGRAPYPWSAAQIAERAKRTIDGLAQVAPLAEAAGQVFGLEALNRFETDIVNTTSQAIEICDAVGSKGLGVMLDTFHMNMEERSIPDCIRATGDRLVHFQANENHRGFPGTGNMDWAAIARALHQVGYQGPVSLEPFRREDDRVGLPIAHWRAPHENEDDKLRAGLALIRSALHFAEVNH